MTATERMEALFWLAVTVAGFATFLTLGPRAFPGVNIDLRVTRDEAQQIAMSWLRARGFDLDGYESAVSFETDTAASVYLQRELGLEGADALSAGGVPIYWWGVRWFRPLEKLEYRVTVLPGGEVAGFERRIEEAAKGVALEQEEARAIATRLLGERHPDLSLWTEVEARAERRENRVDHTFSWQKKDFEAGEAQLRVTIVVQGGEAGEYREYVKVPEEFERYFAREHSRGVLAAIIAGILMTFVMAIAAFIVFLRAYREGELRWRFAGVAAALVLALSLVSLINQLPLLAYRYETQIPYGVFLGGLVSFMAAMTIAWAVWILLSGGAGEFLARRHYPASLNTLHDLMQGRFTPELASSSMRGYALAFGFLGYVTVFYFIGQEYFGVWVPADGPHVNALNTRAPFLYPLLVGIAAAVSEEFAYRLFAIPFLRQFLRQTFIILLIPAAIWAFAHGSYGISPVYVRGIELTIAGLVFGYCFIRYDLWTVLVAHYVIDAFLVGLPLLKSSNSYYQLSGLAVLLLGLVPVLLAVPRLIPGLAVTNRTA